MNPATSSVSKAEIPPGYLNIMGYVDESEVNGPGCRAVVWVQGCQRECAACFNPASWSFEINQLIAAYSRCHVIGKYVVPFCTTPDELGAKGETFAKQMAREIAGVNVDSQMLSPA